ncbi:MAG: class I SAM-dependent methyltransferase [Verrucomicrobia bacterium]|nr:class I SAM-dependent methyltransferase [Verrucomicrobiota bacterium]
MAQFFNRTRVSKSITLKLLRQGRPLSVLVYWLVQASDLGREGIEHSGSYRFADHIYRNVPSGRGRFGRWLDAKFLAMPAVQSFRNRYLAARDELCRFLTERVGHGKPLDVVSAPCGIPRELVEGARLFRERTGQTLEGVTFHGVDLDADLLEQDKRFAAENSLPNFIAHHGDALDRATYPEGADFITCTGLAEFLSDELLERLYRIFFDVLRSDGLLVTSGMKRKRLPDYLLRLAELKTHYRTPPQLAAIARRVPFAEVRTRVDEFGIQTILNARK